MKNLYKAALLAALGIGSITAAKASTQDMLLGFNDAAGPAAANNDYVIDLGLASQFTATSFVDVSALFSASSFTTAFGADNNQANDVAVGFGAGNSTVTPSIPGFLYQTSPAAALTGTPSAGAAGNSAVKFGGSQISPNVYASSTAGGWSALVAAAPGTSAAGTVAQFTANPLALTASGMIAEELYETTLTASGRSTVPTPWADLGQFTVNTTTGSVIWQGANFQAVPEPATYGAFAGAGLLALSLRRQLSRKNA
jgi:PEP-CTERM motif